MMDGFDTLASTSVPSVMAAGTTTMGSMSSTTASTSPWERSSSLSELAGNSNYTSTFDWSNIGGGAVGTASGFGSTSFSAPDSAAGIGPSATPAATTTTTPGPYTSFGTYGGAIDDAVMRRRTSILERVINQQQQDLQRRLDSAVNDKLSKDWALEREWWRNELIGNRNSIVGTTTAATATGGGGGGSGGTGRRLQSLSSGGNALLMSNGSTASSLGADEQSNNIMQQHVDVVRKLILEDDGGYGGGDVGVSSTQHHLLKIIEAFQNTAASSIDWSDNLTSVATENSNNNYNNNIINNNNTGYLTAWKILASVIPRIQNTKQQQQQSTTANYDKALSAACGAMTHYCQQYYTLITSKVNEASLAGLDIGTTGHYSNGMASTVASYTKLVVGSQSSDIWSRLYYCIRCGDFNAANSILETDSMSNNNGSFPEYAVLSKVVRELQRQQGGSACLFQVEGPVVKDDDRDVLYDHLRKTKNLEPNATFKLNVLAILSGEAMESTETIEDHLYGSLWVALLDQDPFNKLIELGSSIRQLGPQYFDGGWGYCLPLLAAQQFKTALSYLQSAGPMELLQAVHIGLVFEVAGVDANDLTAESGAASPLSGVGAPLMLTNGTPSTTGRIIQQENDLICGMLVKYVHLLERDSSINDKSVVVPYLLLIGNINMRRLEIASLIARTDPVLFNKLAGTPDENGNGQRQDCLLDTYLSSDEVSSILDTAATMCKKQVEDQHMALRCASLYLLAGKYASLMCLLNELVSPPDDFSEFKVGWAEQSMNFCRQYLEKRTAVLDSLDQAGKNDLIFSLRTLLQLRVFHKKILEGNFESALQLMMSQIGLLPSSEKQVDEKAANYRTLDRTLQMAFPSAIVGTVNCLYEMFRRFKSDPGSSSSDGLARLKEFQLQVRILFVFCGLIEMPSDMKRSISQMKAGMVSW